MNGGTLFTADTFLWGLGAICQLHRQPFAANLILQQFAPPYTLASLQEATQTLKIKSGIRGVSVSEFHALPQPFLTVLKPRAAGTQPEVPRNSEAARSGSLPNRLAVVLKCDAERILYATENSSAPVTATLKDFDREYAGTVMLCAPEPPALSEADEALVRPREFGFRWFVPELLKHKKIWRDVLLASLAIQLMALATPLFTQVVIDKVVVHQTMSTLIVIGDRAGGVHALQRRHELGAPVPGAAHRQPRRRRAGHAGVRAPASPAAALFRAPPDRACWSRACTAVETIREFVSGAAVTLHPRLARSCSIFLAIMFYYSWLLTLITLAVLLADRAPSASRVAPLLRTRAQPAVPARRAQPGLPHRIRLGHGNGEVAADGAAARRAATATTSRATSQAGFNTRQLANTYNVAANAAGAADDAGHPVSSARWLVMANRGLHHRHAGRLPDVRRAGCRSRCCAWSACGRSSSRPRSRSSAWATS